MAYLRADRAPPPRARGGDRSRQSSAAVAPSSGGTAQRPWVVGSAPLLELQRSAGNRAVSGALQRDRMAPSTDGGQVTVSYGTVLWGSATSASDELLALQAIAAALAGEVGLGVPDRYRRLVGRWEGLVAEMHDPAGAEREGDLLVRVDTTLDSTRPLLATLRAVGSPQIDTFLASEFFAPVKDLRHREALRQAYAAMGDARSGLRTLIGPITRQRLRLLRAEAVEATKAVQLLLAESAAVNTLLAGSADDIFELAEKHGVTVPDLPEPMRAQLRGVPVKHALGNLLQVLSAVTDLTSLLPDDVSRAEREFQERLGAWGAVHGMADTIGKLANITGSVIVVTVTKAAVLAQLAGAGAAAAKLLRYASKFGGEVLGRALGVVEVVKGAIVLFHPESTEDERAEAVMGIGLGVAGVVGGTAGVLAGGVIALGGMGYYVISKYDDIIEGLVSHDLHAALATVGRLGEQIARDGNRVAAALHALPDATPEVAGYLNLIAEKAAVSLRWNLYRLLKPSGGHSEPGYWQPLRERFAPAGVYPSESTPPALALSQARQVLTILHELADDLSTEEGRQMLIEHATAHRLVEMGRLDRGEVEEWCRARLVDRSTWHAGTVGGGYRGPGGPVPGLPDQRIDQQSGDVYIGGTRRIPF